MTTEEGMEQAKEPVTLIDLSGIYWANWHATADKEISAAFDATVRRIADLAHAEPLVAVCCDAPPYWRKEIAPAYKANREAAPPMAVEQLARVIERLRADGLLLWSSPGFEADDVIAWAAGEAVSAGHPVTIVSNDKDLHQLVGPTVRCFAPMTEKTYDESAVKEKHGVYPAQMVDYLALVGDTSDNVPGVPGVGPKTAAALVEAFRTLDGVLAEAAKDGESKITKPKLKASLIEHADAARLSRQLVALRTDVALEWKDIYMERTPEPLVDAAPAEMDDEPEDGAPDPLPEIQPLAVTTPRAAIVHASEPEWSLALEPRSQKGAWEAAKLLFNSRLYGNFGSPEAVYAVILRGRARGLDATTSLAVFHNIQGKIGMHADLIEAEVLRSGKAEYFEFAESTAEIATYVTKRVGGRSEKSLSFTIEDAFRAGLVVRDQDGGYRGVSESGKPSNWDKYRATMLRHRCKTQLARAVYPDVVLGLYGADELGDESMVSA